MAIKQKANVPTRGLQSSGIGRIQNQSGFLLPLALFIVVGLGLLALGISNMGSAHQANATLANVSAQAYYAADAGGQVGLRQLSEHASESSELLSQCQRMATRRIHPAVKGLSNCKVELQCTQTGEVENEAGKGLADLLFEVESTAHCGGGEFKATRTIVITAMVYVPHRTLSAPARVLHWREVSRQRSATYN